jgi:transposase
MSIRTVQRWLKMWSESGDYRPKQNDQKGHSAQITDGEGFRQFVEANQGLTQKEMGVILGVQSFVLLWDTNHKNERTKRCLHIP